MRVWEGMAGMFLSSGLGQGKKANRRVLFDAKEAEEKTRRGGRQKRSSPKTRPSASACFFWEKSSTLRGGKEGGGMSVRRTRATTQCRYYCHAGRG